MAVLVLMSCMIEALHPSDARPNVLNKGLVFLKEKDVLLSGDKWTVVLDFGLSSYYNALSNISQEVVGVSSYYDALSNISQEVEHFSKMLNNQFILDRRVKEINSLNAINC